MFEEILSQPAVNFPISLSTYFLVFGEAFLLGLGISWIYKTKNLSQDKSFQYSLWLIAPIVATLLLFIGSNLALSIGMVGSLSVIRFRTAIKDPIDLMYLFILIMIGLGCGTQNYQISFVASVCMGTILFFLSGKKKSFSDQNLLILKETSRDELEKVLEEVKKMYPKSEISFLNLSEKSNDATLVLPEANNDWVFKLKKQYPQLSVHLMKK